MISFKTTKPNQTGGRRPDHRLILQDPEPEIVRLIPRSGRSQERIWTKADIAALRRHLNNFKPDPAEIAFWQAQAPDDILRTKYSFHSFKRGAAALAWEAVANGQVSLSQLLLLLKHLSVISALEYCPNPITAARAVGTSIAHLTSLRMT
jgi:hypothetical protein